MLLPHRHRASLLDPLNLNPLPGGIQWDGRLAYLDRDGVLNRGSKEYVNSVDEVELLPGAPAVVARLRRTGFRVVVVTNQSPVGRGMWGHTRLEEINDRVIELMVNESDDAHFDMVLYSPYAPSDNAWSRKPNPGMLQVARQLFDADNKESILTEADLIYGLHYSQQEGVPSEASSLMVGDRDADEGAAYNHAVPFHHCDGNLGIASIEDDLF